MGYVVYFNENEYKPEDVDTLEKWEQLPETVKQAIEKPTEKTEKVEKKTKSKKTETVAPEKVEVDEVLTEKENDI